MAHQLSVSITEPGPVPDQAKQIMVPMRDGIRLATDVYLPSGTTGPFPAALTRLPYDKNSRYVFMDRIAGYLTARGYAVVVQDVRGKFRSEGETMPFVHEAADGYDTIEWVVGQDWSDGAVGMFGDSYYGMTQWAAASSRHPALKAITPRVTGADGIRPDYWARYGMMPLFGAYFLECWTDNRAYEFEPDLARRPLADVIADVSEAIGARSAMMDRMVPSLTAIEPYPFGHPFDREPLPVLHMACWYDNILQPSINDWTELSGRPDWAPLQYLHVDSTDHEAYHLDDLPITPDLDHQVSDTALAALLPRYLDAVAGFLDVFVKRAAPPESLPRVRWHHGHLGYRQAPSWPPPGTHQIRLYLGDGTLRPAQPADAGQVRWTHDPSDLVPSVPLDPFSALALAADESALHARPDVVTFTTASLTGPLDLAGPVRARLHLGTDGPAGAHVYAKLLDVAPDGSTFALVRGQLAIGSGPAWTEIDMTHAGYRLRPGHALRLVLASSDYPNFLPHPGTDENPWLAVSGTRTIQSLTSGGDRASYLTLTVLGP